MRNLRKLADAVIDAQGNELIDDSIHKILNDAMQEKIQSMPETTTDDIAKKRTVEALHIAAGPGSFQSPQINLHQI